MIKGERLFLTTGSQRGVFYGAIVIKIESVIQFWSGKTIQKFFFI